MSANDICYIKVVGQHDGGSEFILSGKTLSQNEGEVVDFTPIEHFLAKIAKTGPYWGLTVIEYIEYMWYIHAVTAQKALQN